MSSKQKNHAKQTPSPPSSGAMVFKAPSPEIVQKETEARAHQIYIERTKTGAPGDASSDWHKAEREIKDKYKIK
jgi:hypothetical protein